MGRRHPAAPVVAVGVVLLDGDRVLLVKRGRPPSEGLWTVLTAKKLCVPVEIIKKALAFRIKSKGNPSYTGQVVSALRNQFGGHTVHKK